MRVLRAVLLALLVSLLVGLAIGTAIRIRLERPTYYIGYGTSCDEPGTSSRSNRAALA